MFSYYHHMQRMSILSQSIGDDVRLAMGEQSGDVVGNGMLVIRFLLLGGRRNEPGVVSS
jgi:hypothetical protein